MKKILTIFCALGLTYFAHAQLTWNLKSDISNLHPYVSGGMSYFDFNPSNQNEAVICRADSVRTSSNGGLSWGSPKRAPFSGLFGTLAIGYSGNGNTLYAGTWKQIYRSIDGGNTFTLITDTLKYETQCFDAKGNFIVFGFSACAIVYSKDGGTTWVEKRLKQASSRVQRIHVVSNNVVLVSTASSAFYTKDGGTTWNEVIPPAGGTIAQFHLTATDENNWYMSYTDGNQYMYKSTDGGANWTDIITAWGGKQMSMKNLFATSDGKLFAGLSIDPVGKTPNYKYSVDGGQTWISDTIDGATQGEVRGFKQRGNVLYTYVEYNSTPRIRRFYALDLGGGTNAVSEFNSHNSQIHIYPNPADQTLSLSEFPLGSTVRIMDFSGKVLLESTSDGFENAVNVSRIPNGMYVVQIEHQGVHTHQKLLVQHP